MNYNKSFRQLTIKEKCIITTNSLSTFFIAYILTYHFYLFTTVFASLIMDIRAEIFINRVIFHISSTAWTPTAIEVVFISAPFMCLFLYIVSSIFYIKISIHSGLRKLFIFWITIISFTLFIGEIIGGSILYDGIGYAFSWLYIRDTFRIVTIGISIFTAILIGFRIKHFIILSGNMYLNKIKESEVLSFSLFQFIIPLILGSFVIFMIKYGHNRPYDTIVNFSAFLFIPPLLMNSRRIIAVNYNEKNEINIRLKKNYCVIACVLLLVYFSAYYLTPILNI